MKTILDVEASSTSGSLSECECVVCDRECVSDACGDGDLGV